MTNADDDASDRPGAEAPEHGIDPVPDGEGRGAGPNRLRDAKQRDDNVVAVVAGKVVFELPSDLYIPPDALEVFLETFEGPMDLLLYLIRRQNIDILDIRVAEITEQYMRHIELMRALKLELAGDYLVMAATLTEMKSRMLLPRPKTDDGEEVDPRRELVRRLQAYERIKHAAGKLDELPRLERDLHTAHAAKPEPVKRQAHPNVDLREVLIAFGDVLKRAELHERHPLQPEGLSVRERMSDVLARINNHTGFVPFTDLFDPSEGRRGVIVTFLALMELVREALVDFMQNEPFAPLYVCAPRADAATHDGATGMPASTDETGSES